MTDILQGLGALASPGAQGSDNRTRVKIPEAWRPRVEYGTKGGVLITPAFDPAQEPGIRQFFEDEGLDPDQWMVTNVSIGRWGPKEDPTHISKKINFVPRNPAYVTDAMLEQDLEALINDTIKWKPRKSIKTSRGDLAYAVVNSDQQIGKKSGTGGTKQTVERILDLTERSVHHFHGLRKYGLSFGTIVIPSLGDHVEGNVSQSGRLQGQAASDLGITEQTRVGRRTLMAQVKALAPLTENLLVLPVNGNHDESTRQVSADVADGWNTEITSAVQDACAENEHLQHVQFRYQGSGESALAVDVPGTGVRLGLFHGHELGTSEPANVRKFLAGQSLGRTALGDADVWLSGHFHHFQARDFSQRLWMQAPTIDPGSDFYRNRAGEDSLPGQLTFVFGGDVNPREFIRVLPA